MRATETLNLTLRLARTSLGGTSSSCAHSLASCSTAQIAPASRRFRSTQHVTRPEILVLTPKPPARTAGKSAEEAGAPPKRFDVTDTTSFLKSISRTRRDLTADGPLVAAVGSDWDAMFKLDGAVLKEKGVAVGVRRYFLWSIEKYRQGLDPSQFALRVKPPKKVRGWGPRVQNGIRVSGRKRPGEK